MVNWYEKIYRRCRNSNGTCEFLYSDVFYIGVANQDTNYVKDCNIKTE